MDHVVTRVSTRMKKCTWQWGRELGCNKGMVDCGIQGRFALNIKLQFAATIVTTCY